MKKNKPKENKLGADDPLARLLRLDEDIRPEEQQKLAEQIERMVRN